MIRTEAILGGQGQLHLDLVKYRLEKDFQRVKMEMKNPKIFTAKPSLEKQKQITDLKKQSAELDNLVKFT